MAAAAHFSASLYAIAEGNVPFQDASGNTAFSRVKEFPRSGVASLPTVGTEFYPLRNGFPVTNLSGTFYMYSVIEVQPTGLNVHGVKYLCNDSVATLATSAG